MKKTFLKFFAAVLMVGFAAVSVGCKDYDDDIDALNSAVAGLQQTIAGLQSKLDSGKLVTSITSTNDGITIVLSDGSSYTVTNGKDGKDGQNGGAGSSSVWTIGDDGFWYKDGVKTETKAVGTDGENGVYYVPVTDKDDEHYGFWQVYQDGEAVEPAEYTEEKWLGEGVLTAVQNGNVLTFYGVQDKDGNVIEDGVAVVLGEALGSLEFDPDVLDKTTNYPTTAKNFYQLTYKALNPEKAYAKATKADGKTEADAKVASNVVDLPYFINPAEAYVDTDYTKFNYVVKYVTTRVADNTKTKLSVVGVSKKDGKLTAKTRITTATDGMTMDAPYVLAALRAWNGTCPVTSNFIRVQTPVQVTTAELGTLKTDANKGVADADWKAAAAENVVKAYRLATPVEPADSKTKFNSNANLVQALVAAKDTHASYLDGTAPKYNPYTDEEYYVLYYNNGNGKLDLNKVVRLFIQDTDNKWYPAETLGFDVKYTFSLPTEFKPTDDVTNQQEYVDLNDGVLTPSKKYTASMLERWPIVYVQATIDGNLVAAGYVLVKIEQGGLDNELNVDFSYKYAEKLYNELLATKKSADYTSNFLKPESVHKDLKKDELVNVVAEMEWSDFNKKIYDVLTVAPSTFWKSYYDQKNVTIKVTVDGSEADYKAVVTNTGAPFVSFKNEIKFDKDNQQIVLVNKTIDLTNDLKGDVGELTKAGLETGIEVLISKWNEESITTETSRVRISLNEMVRTQHTWPMYGNKGAKYTVTITVNPQKNVFQRPVVFKHEFFVSHDHENAPELGGIYYNAADKAKLNERGILDENGDKMNTDKLWAYITGAIPAGQANWLIEHKFAELFKSGKLDDLGGNIDYASFWVTPRDFEAGHYYFDTEEEDGDGTNGLNTTTGYLFSTNEKAPQTTKTMDNDTKIGLTVSATVAGDDEADTDIVNDLMYVDHIARTVNYYVTLLNTETCYPNYFYVVFRNEFEVKNTRTIEFDDHVGTQRAMVIGEGFAIVEDMLNAANLPILEWVKTTDKDGKVTYDDLKIADGGTKRNLKFNGNNYITAANSFRIECKFDPEDENYKHLQELLGTEPLENHLKVALKNDGEFHKYNWEVTWTGKEGGIGPDATTVYVEVTINIGNAFKLETRVPVTIKHRA